MRRSFITLFSSGELQPSHLGAIPHSRRCDLSKLPRSLDSRKLALSFLPTRLPGN